MVNPDGTGVTQITDTPENEVGDGWSPDGTQVIANLSRLDSESHPGVPGHLHKGDIAVIGVDTGAVTNLTQSNGVNEGHPHWA
jgi:Tol biopolymer transport system component